MRVGQLSMIAGAIARAVDVGERLGCEDDRGVLLAQGLQPFPDLAGEAAVVEREPALVDDEKGRPAVEPVLDPVKEIGKDGRRRAGTNQALGLEGLNVRSRPVAPTRRRAGGPRDQRSYRAEAPASAHSTAGGPKGR